MNIEAMNLLSPVPSGVTAETGAPAVTVDGATAVAGVFSGTLMTQIELLNNLKAGAAPLPAAPGVSVMQNVVPGEQPGASVGQSVGQNAPVLENVVETDKNNPNLQAIVASQNVDSPKDVVSVPANNVDVQEIAVSVGNDFPPSYKIKDNVDHEAALAAVNDSLKYISASARPEDKAVQMDQQTVDHEAALAAVNDSLKYISANVSPDDKVAQTDLQAITQESNNVPAMQESVEQNTINVIAKVIRPVQNKEVNSAQENERNEIKAAVVIDVPAQKIPEQLGESFSQKQTETKTKESVDDQKAAEELLAAIMFVPVKSTPAEQVSPAEQVQSVNYLASAPVIANAVKQNVKQEAPLLAEVMVPSENINLTPSNSNVQSSAPTNNSLDTPVKNSVNTSQGEAVFNLPVQTKQNLATTDVGVSSQIETGGLLDRQVVNMETGKVALNANANAVQAAPTEIESKAEVPAITKPLTHPEWSKDLGDRIVWMNNKAMPAAEIRLNPQHLGPISVRVNVSDDQASIVFTAQHAAVRETLEASIPKLREMMSAQNLNLADVNVAQSFSSDQGGRSQSQNSAQSFADTGGSNRPGAGTSVMEEGDGVLEQEIDSGRATVSKGILSLYA